MTAQDIHFETEIREYTPLDANYPERLRCIDKPPAPETGRTTDRR